MHGENKAQFSDLSQEEWPKILLISPWTLNTLIYSVHPNLSFSHKKNPNKTMNQRPLPPNPNKTQPLPKKEPTKQKPNPQIHNNRRDFIITNT